MKELKIKSKSSSIKSEKVSEERGIGGRIRSSHSTSTDSEGGDVPTMESSSDVPGETTDCSPPERKDKGDEGTVEEGEVSDFGLRTALEVRVRNVSVVKR